MRKTNSMIKFAFLFCKGGKTRQKKKALGVSEIEKEPKKCIGNGQTNPKGLCKYIEKTNPVKNMKMIETILFDSKA